MCEKESSRCTDLPSWINSSAESSCLLSFFTCLYWMKHSLSSWSSFRHSLMWLSGKQSNRRGVKEQQSQTNEQSSKQGNRSICMADSSALTWGIRGGLRGGSAAGWALGRQRGCRCVAWLRAWDLGWLSVDPPSECSNLHEALSTPDPRERSETKTDNEKLNQTVQDSQQIKDFKS